MTGDEEEPRGSPDWGSEDGALKDHIAHWVEVLDTWVRRVDLGMGRRGGVKQMEGGEIDDSPPHPDDDVGSAKGVEG